MNSWAKTETIDLEDVREGRIPFTDPNKFKDMNKIVCNLARKLGDEGPVSEAAAKRKFSSRNSGKDVLSGVIKIVEAEEQNIQQLSDDRLDLFYDWLESCFPRSLEPEWLNHIASEGDLAWNAIADTFWNFLSDSYAGVAVQLSAILGLSGIYKINVGCDLKTISTSQKHFFIATSILFYISHYQADLIHTPLEHACWGSCTTKIICYVASNSGPGDLQHFNHMLENNAMWRCYEEKGHYDLLNKLLVLTAKGTGAYILETDRVIDILAIDKLLEYDAEPKTTLGIDYHKKKTALDYAVKWEDEDLGIECAQILLDKCGDLANVTDVKGRTAVYRASSVGNARICQLLLHYNARLDVQDEKGKTALHYAVKNRKRNEKVLNVLMQSPQITDFVDLRDKKGESPLDIAAAQGGGDNDIELMANLLSKLKQPETYFNKVDLDRLLRQSLVKGYVNNVEKLFQNGAKLLDDDGDDDQGKTALHLAAMCEDGDKAGDMVEIILSKTKEKDNLVAQCDKRGRSVLHLSALTGHVSLSRDLLDRNPKLIYIKDTEGRTPLHYAVEGKHDEAAVLRTLLAAYLKKVTSRHDLIDSRGLTPLHIAISQGKTQLVRALLSNQEFRKKYLVTADSLGQTALHKAAQCGDVDTVRSLLDYGAQPLKERDCEGRTALHYAVEAKIELEDKKKMASLLIKGCSSEEDRLLFLWAFTEGGTADENLSNPMLQEFLFQQKEEIKRRLGTDNLLKTAACQGDIEMAKELLTRGGRISDIQDQEWRKSLEPSKRKNVEKVSKQLEKIVEQGKRIAEEGNDQPTMTDYLGRGDYAQGLAALFLNPYLKSPIVVGISGSWGMGKSSLMIQTESILLKTAAQLSLLPSSSSQSSFPGVKILKLSQKGKKKYNEINRWVEFLNDDHRSTAKKLNNEESQPGAHGDALVKFLNNYERKYHHIFKSLAVMDSSDMFTTNADQGASPIEGGIPAILTVQYNAWKYKSDTEALAGMAVEITKEIEQAMTDAQWVSTCWRNTWRKQKQNILIDIVFPCVLVVLLACSLTWVVLLIFGRYDRYNAKAGAEAKYACLPIAIIIIVWTLVKAIMDILKPVSSQLMHYISLPDHREKLGYQERVIDDITFLKDEVSKKPYSLFTAFVILWHLITGFKWSTTSLFSHPKWLGNTTDIKNIVPKSTNLRIIVFVDDLDRCEESVILQVLSAVNLVLAVCEINVVLGMDKELIERAVMKKYGDKKTNKSSKSSQDLADKYLQKIVQLPLDLPDPSEEQSKRFLEGQIGMFQEDGNDSDSESVTDAHVTTILNGTTSMPDAERSRESRLDSHTQREAGPEDNASTAIAIAIDVPTPDVQTPTELRREAPPESDAARVNTSHQQPENRISSNIPSSPISIREMLFIGYSQRERDAFGYFQMLATDSRKLPREWKRLLNYHRLVWNIFSESNEAKVLAGWKVQLVTWIFVCWEWQQIINFIIENWNNIGIIKTSGSNGPSLKMIVEHLIEEQESNKNKKMAAASYKGNVTKITEYPQKKEKTSEILREAEGNASKTTEEPESSSREPEKLEEAAEEKIVRITNPEEDIGKSSYDSESSKRVSAEKSESAVKEQPDTLQKILRNELHKLKKELKEQILNELRNEIKELKEHVAQEIQEVKQQVSKQQSQKNEKKVEEKEIKLQNLQNWRRLKTALHRYDVPMDAIHAFQRFRFYCTAGYLPRPNSREKIGDTL